MKNIIWLIYFLFVLISTNGQPSIKKYVRENAQAIKSIDANDTSYADLEVIGNAIGEKRIVMLGELSHGDGSAFSAKSRIVKYLHEKLGFNVIAFESDFFALNKGWEAAEKKDVSINYLFQSSIYPIWTRCRQCRAVFDYLKNESVTTNKLILTGFDNQLVSAFSKKFLKKELQSFLDNTGIGFIHTPDYPRYLLLIDSLTGFRNKADSVVWDTLINTTTTILSQLQAKHNDNDFFMKVLENLKSFSLQARYTWINMNENYVAGASVIRDPQMAANLKWLATVKYPNEKIIVWANNVHIAKNNDVTYKQKFNDRYSMGYDFTSDPVVLNQTYVLGFTSYSGISKLTTLDAPDQLKKPLNNSLEFWLKEKSRPFSFIDFTNFVQRNPANVERFYMKRSTDTEADSYWHKIYDGIFYIEEMQPCETIESINPGSGK